MKIKTFIGWDIGGSNTKISIIKSNKAKSEVHEIELWRDAGLSKLKKLISDLGTNQNGTYHGITLSGEMCDIFPSRENGINTILSFFKKFSSNTYVYSSSGFIKLHKIREHKKVASMNWYSVGEMISKKIDNCIIINMGSTTTDFIMIKNNTIINKREDDFTGINNDELLYTGFLRSPIYALTDEVRVNMISYKVIPENFSSMADIYQILKIIDIKYDYSSRADRRSKTILNSYKRVARSFGFDFKHNHKKIIEKLCQEIMHIHITKIYRSLRIIIKKNSYKNNNVKIIGLGIGITLIKKMVNKYNMTYINMNTVLKNHPVRFDKKTLIHFPSYAVAYLLREKHE